MSSPFVWFHHNGQKSKQITQFYESLFSWKSSAGPGGMTMLATGAGPFAAVGIESDRGFEIGIELVAKARRARLPVAEIPTIWLERTFGASNFRLWAWLPRYLRWYAYAFGPRTPLEGFSPKPLPLLKGDS